MLIISVYFMIFLDFRDDIPQVKSNSFDHKSLLFSLIPPLSLYETSI